MPKEREPLKKQIIDALYIEGIKILPIHKDLIIESVDGVEILKNKENYPLLSQIVDSLSIEGIDKNDNEMQQTSQMTILKTPKTPNIIESMENLFIKPKEKEILKYQKVDQLLIEENNRPENKIQLADKIEILKNPKLQINIIEIRDNIKLLSIEKEPLKNQIVDKLLIEGNNIPDNIIQVVDKMEILKAPKKENIIIEQNDNLFIPPKEKQLLKNQIVDNILIEGNIRQDNAIQNVDKMDILRTPKPENKIEIKDNILIEPIEKEPLFKQLVDDLFIESIKN